jgi:sortase A
MKSKTATILLAIGFTLGLSLLLYPTVSNYWNSVHQGRVVTDYNTMVASLFRQDYEQIFASAEEYNQSLLTNPDRFDINETTDETYYNSLLSINDSQ